MNARAGRGQSYESLLKDKSQLAASDAAHRAELERTRNATTTPCAGTTIFKANNHLIDHPDLIYPEQVLIVPH